MWLGWSQRGEKQQDIGGEIHAGVWYHIGKTVVFTLNEMASQFNGFGGRRKVKLVCLGCHLELDQYVIFKSILCDKANYNFNTGF